MGTYTLEAISTKSLCLLRSTEPKLLNYFIKVHPVKVKREKRIFQLFELSRLFEVNPYPFGASNNRDSTISYLKFSRTPLYHRTPPHWKNRPKYHPREITEQKSHPHWKNPVQSLLEKIMIFRYSFAVLTGSFEF